MVEVCGGGGREPAVKYQLCSTFKLGSFNSFSDGRSYPSSSFLYFTIKTKMGPTARIELIFKFYLY